MTAAERPDEESSVANGVASILRVYGQWIVVTVMVAVVLFASAGRVNLPMFWVYLAGRFDAAFDGRIAVHARDRLGHVDGTG